MGRRGDTRPAMGWRVYVMSTPPEVAEKRLSGCPIKSVREKMSVIRKGKQVRVHYKEGMFGHDEIQCVKWILLSRVPDDRAITPEHAERIFAWVRKTL